MKLYQKGKLLLGKVEDRPQKGYHKSCGNKYNSLSFLCQTMNSVFDNIECIKNVPKIG